MPVTRRDDSRDPLAPHILLLWQKKWLIMAVAVTAAVLTYVGLLFVNSSYKVTAEVFVNRLPSVPNGETPNPDTVSSLLKSQSVIGQVRDDFAEKFNVEPPKIERFIKGFSVDSAVLQDTSVRKEVSPVLKLEVESQGAEETRYIMERWLRHFVAEFGNYTVQEAIVKRDAYLDEKNSIEQQMDQLVQQQIELEARLPFIRKVLAELLDQLSPAKLRQAPDPEDTNQNIQFIVQSPRLAPGLMERHAELRLLQKTGSLPTTGALQLTALEQSINDVQTSVTTVQKEYADILTQDARLNRQITMLSETRKEINAAITRFTVASAVYRQPTAEGLPAGGDIRALSMPVLPEARVWPKRTSAALVAGIVGAIFATLFVIAQSYLKNLRLSENQ